MDPQVILGLFGAAITALYGLTVKLFYDRLADKDSTLKQSLEAHKVAIEALTKLHVEEMKKRDDRISMQDAKIETLSNVLGKNTEALGLVGQTQADQTRISQQLLDTLKQLTS